MLKQEQRKIPFNIVGVSSTSYALNDRTLLVQATQLACRKKLGRLYIPEQARQVFIVEKQPKKTTPAQLISLDSTQIDLKKVAFSASKEPKAQNVK